MHFWVETVNEKSQKAFPILEAMARMLYKLGSLQNLILVFNILLTQCHGFKSSQSLKDMKRQRVNPTDAHHLTVTVTAHLLWSHCEPQGKEAHRTGMRSPEGRC